jgi:hypothetical protein
MSECLLECAGLQYLSAPQGSSSAAKCYTPVSMYGQHFVLVVLSLRPLEVTQSGTRSSPITPPFNVGTVSVCATPPPSLYSSPGMLL